MLKNNHNFLFQNNSVEIWKDKNSKKNATKKAIQIWNVNVENKVEMIKLSQNQLRHKLILIIVLDIYIKL